MKLSWLGHSCFSLESGGYKIILDPFRDVPGLRDTDGEANEVFCSHGHFDHAYREGVRLVPGPSCPFMITELKAYHDDKKGALRGENTIRRFEAGGISVVHLGDLGHSLSREQQSKIMSPDVLLIPVGGTYTIDAAAAKEVALSLKPRVIIPMHYRQGGKGFPELQPLEEFTSLFPADFIKRYEASSLELSPAMPYQLAVLKMP